MKLPEVVVRLAELRWHGVTRLLLKLHALPVNVAVLVLGPRLACEGAILLVNERFAGGNGLENLGRGASF